ncbi:NADP-dependent oxidoreductase [Pseudonocardia sp. RS11V-5]|uniref:NADP-dependent oxidoreductase n=1 Tax=Pseudonocardia terrae TaxID=2905831 RepID=UPI001E550251|nr:NADP-dependent oxidoreductase [Pseudonocardia terrae]MCE3550779.1 NADP-dependent oxidoreductase [Pseudonocardia terrae]
MRAVVFREFGGPEVLEVADVPEPAPGPGEVRIAVEAAAVNPIDLATRAGFTVQAGLAPAPQGDFRRGLGWDVAGRIDAVGDGVDGLRPGDAVITMLPAFAVPVGAQAERVVVPAADVAPAPEGVETAAAATLALNALTAAAALDDLAAPAGATLLVIGGAGGVGAFAVQLGVRAGLRVIATASERDEAAVRGYGAEVVCRDALPTGVDAVLDTAATGAAALAPVRDGGTLVTVAGPVPAERGIRSVQTIVRPDGGRLTELSALAAKGELTLPVATTYPLDDVAAAHERLAAGGVGGRLVLLP